MKRLTQQGQRKKKRAKEIMAMKMNCLEHQKVYKKREKGERKESSDGRVINRASKLARKREKRLAHKRIGYGTGKKSDK